MPGSRFAKEQPAAPLIFRLLQWSLIVIGMVPHLLRRGPESQ
jgi:hypothetical protein